MQGKVKAGAGIASGMLAVDRFPALCADRGWGARLKLGGEKRGGFGNIILCPHPSAQHTAGDEAPREREGKLDGLILDEAGGLLFFLNQEKNEGRNDNFEGDVRGTKRAEDPLKKKKITTEGK